MFCETPSITVCHFHRGNLAEQTLTSVQTNEYARFGKGLGVYGNNHKRKKEGEKTKKERECV